MKQENKPGRNQGSSAEQTREELTAKIQEQDKKIRELEAKIKILESRQEPESGDPNGSRERFQQLADAMPQLVWTAEPDGEVDYYNKRMELYAGISREDDGSWNWSPVLHPEDIEATVQAWNHSVETGEAYQIEHRVRMADGSYRWHLSRGIPATGEDGKLVKWYGAATDIHEQKVIEQELRSSEKRLRRLADSNIIGIAYRTESGVIYDANDAYLNLIGYTREELETGNVRWDKITPEEYIHLDLEAAAVAKKQGACKPYEKEYIRKDGKRIPILIGYALLDESKDDYIGFVLDLSELKIAQKSLQEYTDKLEQSNKELENFAFIASHDLQEPLRKVQAFGERIQKRLEGKLDTQTEDFFHRMLDAAERMQAMIDALLNLSRISTRGQTFEPVDLNAAIKDAVANLEERIKETNGQVIIEKMPSVNADPDQMRQLFQNLINNALKYHKPDEPPIVSVWAARTSGGIGSMAGFRIFVKDNGIGFDERFSDQIFLPFHRLVGRSQYEGTGIGLAICQKIVERHGGEITVNSKPGHGSIFSVTFPDN